MNQWKHFLKNIRIYPTHFFISALFLAVWRLRQTWVMLLVTCVGVLAAVMFACVVPLYSYTAATAGLRNVLSSPSGDANIRVHATMREVSTQIATTVTRQVEALTTSLSPYLNSSPQFALRTRGFQLVSSSPENKNDTFVLSGYSIQQLASHVTVLQGRLPRSLSADVEIAVTPETAQILHAHIGSVIHVPLNYSEYSEVKSNNGLFVPMPSFYQQLLSLHVVGFYEEKAANDPLWNGYDVNPVEQNQRGQVASIQLDALVSNSTILASLDAIASKTHDDTVYGSEVSDFYWTYTYATSRISVGQLDKLISDLQAWQTTLNNAYGSLGDAISISEQSYESHVELTSSTLSTPQTPSVLEQYRTRLGVVHIPTTILLIEVVALLLLFVGIMTELLIERQVDAIAVLRSRGASSLQIFGAFTVQGICLSIVAFLLGPLLALYVISVLTLQVPVLKEQNVSNVIWSNVSNNLLLIRPYATLVALTAFIVIVFSIYRAMKGNILTRRRESARSTERSLWQYLKLDVVAAVIALTGYGISVYVSNVLPPNSSSQVVIASPLSLIAPLFLLIAAVLLLLRLFPLLLHVSASLAARGQGAAAMIALGHIARTPRHSSRLILLLSLTCAFTVFTLIFLASQEQRGADLASYQVGSDFSGKLGATDSVLPLSQQTAAFKHIHGVTSSTLGYVAEGIVGESSDSSSVQIVAVDAGTFAQTALWNAQDSIQPLSSLLAILIAQRKQAIQTHMLPVMVDAATWQQLHLSPGEHFSVQVTNAAGSGGSGRINCIALLKVSHIPTVSPASVTSLPMGILADYQSYASIYQEEQSSSLTPNYVWLRTRTDAASLANVRASLANQSPRVAFLLDRDAIVDALHTDPLYLSIIGELMLGIATALLVTFFGTLLAFWLSIWSRLSNFAVLRAFGTSLFQLNRILLWEQGVTYITALCMGTILGIVFSASAIPVLVFSSLAPIGSTETISNQTFYALQHFLPVQLALPVHILPVLILLSASCTIVFGVVAYGVTHFSLNEKLRLNED